MFPFDDVIMQHFYLHVDGIIISQSANALDKLEDRRLQHAVVETIVFEAVSLCDAFFS